MAKLERHETDSAALDKITALLRGEWDALTLAEVEEIVRATGRETRAAAQREG